jgi:hypothetical protein
MKNITLLLVFSLAFTAWAETPKQDTIYKAKVYETRPMRYRPA